MAISLRSSTTVAYGTRTNTTVTAPAGATTGDVIVVVMDSGATALASVTGPSGWTKLGSVVYSATDPWYVELSVWAKPHDGAGSWVFTHSSADTQATALCYTGVDNTTFADATATTANKNNVTSDGLTTATPVAPSLTTATDGALLIASRGSWDGNAITPPTGWTERYDAPVLWVGEKVQATAGTTGTVTVDSGNGTEGSVSKPWGIVLAALRPAGGGTNGSVTAVPATATATALTPTVAGSGDAAVQGAVATATAAAVVPVVSAGSTVTSVAATATAEAIGPTVGAETVVSGSQASATATALAPTISASSTITAVAATATAAALPPGVSGGSSSGTGTATGSYAFDGTSAGRTGKVSDWSDSASATTTAAGSKSGFASGSWAFSGSASGTSPLLPNSGSVTESISWVGSASGLAPTIGVHSGSVSGSFDFAGSASGAIEHRGTTGGSFTFVGTASGVGTDPTFTFEPPTYTKVVAPPPLTRRPRISLTESVSVVRVNGVLVSVRNPSNEQLEAAGTEGEDWFVGGHVYTHVPKAVGLELQAAGYDVTEN